MSQIITWLKGKKTYLVSLAIVVVAALSYFKVIPEPNVIIGAAVAIAALAATFRSALKDAVKALEELGQ
jgi:hypothetical protein